MKIKHGMIRATRDMVDPQLHRPEIGEQAFGYK